jgi:hypothetical protein
MVDVTGPTKASWRRGRSHGPVPGHPQLYVIAMKEQIAAALERRSFQTIKDRAADSDRRVCGGHFFPAR